MSDAFEDELIAIDGATEALAAAPAATPPDGLADRLLARARHRRAPGLPVDLGPLPSARQLYRSQVDRLDDLLAGLTGEAWTTPVPPYSWNVHEVVAHLLAIERYTAEVLGLSPASSWTDEHDHLAISQPTIDGQRDGPPHETLVAWRGAAATIAGSSDRLDQTRYHGLELATESVLIARSFELWTHADDIRRALARPMLDPPAEEVRVMADLSVRSMTYAAERPVRIVLTGAGGGTWVVDDGGADHHGEAGFVMADAVDYCRYAARRLERDELDTDVDGDRPLVERLLETARSFAV